MVTLLKFERNKTIKERGNYWKITIFFHKMRKWLDWHERITLDGKSKTEMVLLRKTK